MIAKQAIVEVNFVLVDWKKDFIEETASEDWQERVQIQKTKLRQILNQIVKSLENNLLSQVPN